MIFVFFISFHCPQLFLLLPLPYRCSGVPEYASCVNSLRQTVSYKRECDVML